MMSRFLEAIFDQFWSFLSDGNFSKKIQKFQEKLTSHFHENCRKDIRTNPNAKDPSGHNRGSNQVLKYSLILRT